jgi:hypothetical protein
MGFDLSTLLTPVEGLHVLTRPFEKEEMDLVIKHMAPDKSPGPDGFNVEFYIATWDWIGSDVMQLVRNFFQTGIMPAHINDTHIALIPKKLVPLIPADYRPISFAMLFTKLLLNVLLID